MGLSSLQRLQSTGSLTLLGGLEYKIVITVGTKATTHVVISAHAHRYKTKTSTNVI